RRHTRSYGDWSSDVCSSDLNFPNHAATAVILAAGVVMLAACISCGHTAPANVAAEVDGHAITYAVLEKTYQTQYAQQTEGASPRSEERRVGKEWRERRTTES